MMTFRKHFRFRHAETIHKFQCSNLLNFRLWEETGLLTERDPNCHYLGNRTQDLQLLGDSVTLPRGVNKAVITRERTEVKVFAPFLSRMPQVGCRLTLNVTFKIPDEYRNPSWALEQVP